LRASKAQQMDIYSSEILLRNIRVLAIGPNIQEKDGARAAVGETATLELDPDQVKAIALAQRAGWLALALRSAADANTPQPAAHTQTTTTVTIMRGVQGEEYAVLQSGQ
jgi:pilus assembly protein CpaB